MAIALGRCRAAGVLSAAVALALVSGCGGGGQEQQNYSASSFSECLASKDVAPKDMATGQPEGDRYFDALDRLASDAAEQNGAIEAFGNDALPGASTIYFLFYRGHDAAQQAQTRLVRIGKQEGSGDKITVRGNLLSVASTQTEAETRIIEECLGKASS
jgi:hypothetical protein